MHILKDFGYTIQLYVFQKADRAIEFLFSSYFSVCLRKSRKYIIYEISQYTKTFDIHSTSARFYFRRQAFRSTLFLPMALYRAPKQIIGTNTTLRQCQWVRVLKNAEYGLTLNLGTCFNESSYIITHTYNVSVWVEIWNVSPWCTGIVCRGCERLRRGCKIPHLVHVGELPATNRRAVIYSISGVDYSIRFIKII